MESSSAVNGGMESSASKSRPQSRRGVRVVGKIRPFLDGDSSRSSNRAHMSITKVDEDHALIAFGDQTSGDSRKDCYKLDRCYEKDESVAEVFTHEVKPMLESLFCGSNACVIAYGARGSGKSQLIQGSEENPGLALLSVSHILSSASEFGGSLSISCYEVCQDHIYDLLEPKEQEVLILEDAARKIQLKGLSQVSVNSVSDFKKLYYQGISQRKYSHGIANESSTRSHRGLIMYVSCVNKDSNKSLIGKMNFVDLAGYEDTKQKTNSKPHVADCVKVNKSLYTLLNVVYTLNANQSYIPYRESKLTRLLQDCLCRTSQALLITCLNPTFCQDTVHALNLASRSCQVVNQYRHDMARITKNNSRFLPVVSPSTGGIHSLDNSLKKREFSPIVSTEKKGNGTPTATKMRMKPLGSSVKKPGAHTFGSLNKKPNDSPSISKERKLFNAPSHVTSNMKGNVLLKSVLAVESIDEGDTNLDLAIAEYSMLEEGNSVLVDLDGVYSVISEVDDGHSNKHNDIQDEGISLEIDQKPSIDPQDGTKQEIQNSLCKEDQPSPPISKKLRDLSNSLKLFSIQSTSCGTPKSDALYVKDTSEETIDPKSPSVSFDMRFDSDSKYDFISTPQDILKTRSTGIKKSLVQECLAFLNSANKEELKELKGIGEKRATYILELRHKSPEPFKDIDDLKHLGLTKKQINSMMSRVLGDF